MVPVIFFGFLFFGVFCFLVADVCRWSSSSGFFREHIPNYGHPERGNLFPSRTGISYI